MHQILGKIHYLAIAAMLISLFAGIFMLIYGNQFKTTVQYLTPRVTAVFIISTLLYIFAPSPEFSEQAIHQNSFEVEK